MTRFNRDQESSYTSDLSVAALVFKHLYESAQLDELTI